MTTTARRSARKLALVALLPLGLVAAASCSPAPPTCPTIESGTWSGTWSSVTFPGAGGGVSASITVDGTSIDGTVQLSGSVNTSPVDVTGAVSCDHVTITSDTGLVLTGTLAADGNSIDGTYTSTVPSDNGIFAVEVD